MDLSIALRRREAKQILTVQLVGDLRECGAEILTGSNLHVTAASFFRHFRETRIGPVLHQRRLQTTRAESRHLLTPATSHADSVDHHAELACAIDHFDLAHELRPEPSGTAVLSVTQDEDDRSPIVFLTILEDAEAFVDRAPQRRRRIWRNRTRERCLQLHGIAYERPSDRHVMPKGTEANSVVH